MEMNSFIFKGTKSLKMKIVSTSMLILGIMWIQYRLFGGLIVSFGSIVLFATVVGIQIDFENKKYRLALFFGPNAFGKWKELPDIKYISVFKTTYVRTVRGIAGVGSVSSSEKTIVVNLIHGKNKRLKVYATDDVNDGFEKANYIAKKLDLKIYDATERVGKWIQ